MKREIDEICAKMISTTAKESVKFDMLSVMIENET